MRNLTAVAAIATATVLSLASPVHAESSPDDWGAAAVVIPIFLGLEVTSLALGTVDLVARPQSRTYAGVEVAVGGATAVLNTYLAIDFATTDNCSDCMSFVPVFAGLALIDAAVAAHGPTCSCGTSLRRYHSAARAVAYPRRSSPMARSEAPA